MKIYIQKYIEKQVERILMDLFLQLDNIKEKMLVMSGTNSESKYTVLRRRIPAAIRQITPAAPANSKILVGLQVLPDEKIPN